MTFLRLARALLVAWPAIFGCASVYVPPDEPPTEASLGEAIATLRDTDARVELLEDGLVADVWVYELRRVSSTSWRDPHDWRMDDPIGPENQHVRMLVGPKRGVHLPYASIRSVTARVWPLWSAVEIVVDEATRDPDAGPVVIKVGSKEEAQRLSDAIDRVRRTRIPG